MSRGIREYLMSSLSSSVERFRFYAIVAEILVQVFKGSTRVDADPDSSPIFGDLVSHGNEFRIAPFLYLGLLDLSRMVS